MRETGMLICSPASLYSGYGRVDRQPWFMGTRIGTGQRVTIGCCVWVPVLLGMVRDFKDGIGKGAGCVMF